MDAVNSCGLKCVKLSDLGDKVVDNLLARELLEYDFVYEGSNQGYANKENVTVQINSRNHVEVFAIGTSILDAYSSAKEIDKNLCNKLNFAYSDKYGFLTPDIKNIGSGMSVEIKTAGYEGAGLVMGISDKNE
jgi:protein arginine kinase